MTETIQVDSFPLVLWPVETYLFFSTEPPFNCHDWIVCRPKSGEEVCYMIDYYLAPP